MINPISCKCPECGAELQVEGNREFAFCTYCGAKIMLQNDNEQIYHYINDADIKRAETEQLIEIKRMEIAERKQAAAEKIKAKKVRISVVVGIVMVLAFATELINPLLGIGGITIGAWLGIVLIAMWAKGDNKSDDIDEDGRVKVPSGISDFENKNYVAIESMFKSAGFTNVQSIPMNDLTTGILKKPGMVDSIIVNGKPISSGGKRFYPDATVVISYHSFANR
jgi:DNA-directed RNA polymerase subunit RPC12/RpoP